MLGVENLIPTQDGYRLDSSTRQSMLDFVADAGVYNEDSIKSHRCTRNSLIAVTRFPDGKLFLRDGLHRVTSVYIARIIPALFDEEYVIENMTYDMWTNPAPDNGWYTPFDPRKEVRVPDFLKFKEKALDLQGEELVQYILDNKHQYVVPRTESHTIQALAALWEIKSEPITG